VRVEDHSHSTGCDLTCRTASSTADANSSGLIPWSETFRSTLSKIACMPARDRVLSNGVGSWPGLTTSQYSTWSLLSCCPINDSSSRRSSSERSATLLESFDSMLKLYHVDRRASNPRRTQAAFAAIAEVRPSEKPAYTADS